MLAERDSFPLRKGGLEIRKLQGVGPVTIIGSAKNFEDFEDLIDF